MDVGPQVVGAEVHGGHEDVRHVVQQHAEYHNWERPHQGLGNRRLTEPAETALAEEFRTRGRLVREAAARRDYLEAFRLAAGFRPSVDRFFTDVMVMCEDEKLRAARLGLLAHVERLFLRHLGVTPGRYYMRLRLERARELKMGAA